MALRKGSLLWIRMVLEFFGEVISLKWKHVEGSERARPMGQQKLLQVGESLCPGLRNGAAHPALEKLHTGLSRVASWSRNSLTSHRK